MPREHSLSSFVTSSAPRYMLRLAVLGRVFDRYLSPNISSFLEIGVGLGDVSHYLTKQPQIKSGLAVEFSPEAANLLRKRTAHSSKLQVLEEDFLRGDYSQVDLVCAFEVLEHIEDDLSFIRKINQSLNSNGLFLASVPAYQKKWQPQDTWAGHVRRYEKEELMSKLAQGGFEVIELIDYGFPLLSLIRPAKEIYYRWANKKRAHITSSLDKTMQSGTERPLFKQQHKLLWQILYAPFVLIQPLFFKSKLGDGLVVIARKK